MIKNTLGAKYIFNCIVLIVATLSPLLVVAQTARSAPNNGPASGKLKWDVRIYERNRNYVEVILDTRNFQSRTCLYDMSVRVDFLDNRGRIKHRNRYEFDKAVEQGSVYVQWFPHDYQNILSVKGEHIDYEMNNCGSRLTRLTCPKRNFWQRLFGIESECRKKLKKRISEEQVDPFGPNLIRNIEGQGQIDLDKLSPTLMSEAPKSKSQ